MKLITKIFAAFVAFSPLAHAEVVEYTLDIRETTISPAGKPVKALTINGGLPGPVLRFKEGDTARIHVVNGLTHEEVSTHWHGLLVPNLEDGVPYLTTPPIFPGKSRTFEFPLKHAGTYWYHSHTGLQEQRGVYGSIVIEPKQGERIRADKEEVLPLLKRDASHDGIASTDSDSRLGAALHECGIFGAVLMVRHSRPCSPVG